jgi:soluble P-type ATPase
MLDIRIPGRGAQSYRYLVLDLNGTLALDGALLPGVADRLRALSGLFGIQVITADTFGKAADSLRDLPLELMVLDARARGEVKAAAVEKLGGSRTIAVGNGSNDGAMLKEAALGIAVNGPEGCAREALLAADILAPDIRAALDLLLEPERLVATLRR